jgi:kynurenine formamidase
MRRLIVGTAALLVTGAISAAAVRSQGIGSLDATHPLVTKEQYARWVTELSNWGRWGPNDEMGTLNLITPAKRKQAAALVKDGIAVSLSLTESTHKEPDNPSPIDWTMLTASQSGATDRVGYPAIHGPGHTHLDSLAHVFFDGKMWNGYPVSQFVTKEAGAAKASILTMKSGVVTRGVLYDMARLKGVPYLKPGTRVYAEDLEAWEKKIGTKVGPGDALIFRWGRWSREARPGELSTQESAGLDNSVLPWLKKRDIALLGWETPGYAPVPEGDVPGLAIHNMVLTILGAHILDRCDLEALSEAAATRNRWDFMLILAPLAIPNGTGSPVNPIAMF